MGHDWFYERFILLKPNCAFIQSHITDNKLIGKQYEQRLREMSADKVAIWADGNFEVRSGMYFKPNLLQIIDLNQEPDHEYYILDELIQSMDDIWGSLDHGRVHYTVFYLHGMRNGKNYLLLEYASKHLTPAKNSVGIIKMLRRFMVDHETLNIYAGHDCFSKDAYNKTIAGGYQEHGITLTRAIIKRALGAEYIEKLMFEASLYVTTHCIGLINTYLKLRISSRDAKDVKKWDSSITDNDRKTGDDFYDSARYGIITRSQQVTPELPRERDVFDYYSTI